MGTVGLSFGSPTSGTGFDVSTTVASIMSNLQNVETPWKTELTSLQSKDTAISSLGTLFSNLSNDLSSLTDLTGIMAQKTGSSSDTNVLQLTAADSSAVAGTHTVTVTSLATTSSGYLSEIADASDTLSGSVTLQVGTGTAQTISVPTTSGDNTLAGLAAAINSSGVGINASVLTDSSGSRLSLVSGTSGKNGNITVSSNQIVDTTNHLNYTGSAGTDASGSTSATTSTGTLTGIADASDTLSGSISIQVGNGAPVVVDLTSTDDALSTLATALNGVANIGVKASVVTNGDGTSSLQLVSNTSGSAGTLTVTSSIVDASTPSSTSLGYTSPVSGADAVLSVDGVSLTSASNTVTNLIPGLTFQLLAPSTKESDASLEQVQVVIGNDNTDVESTVNQFVTDYNSLVSAMNTQEGNDSSGNAEPLFGSPTLSLLQQQLLSGLNVQNPNGSLASIATDTGTTLSGKISIQVGSGIVENFDVPDSPDNTLSGLAATINASNMGVTATVVTSNGESTLSLLSHTAGSSGALSVTSAITATSDQLLSYTGSAGTDATSASSATTSNGTLSGVPSTGDTLTGSIAIQVGSGATQTITLGTATLPDGDPVDSLSSLETYINDNSTSLGVSASIVQNTGADTYSLTLTSNTAGTAGNLTVTSSILDTTNTSSTTLNYTNSSDISTLANLGITVSSSDDGTLTFDATSLDSVLNSDYSGVVGFFQNTNSWGQSFATMLNNSGSTSTTGILSLAAKADSSTESTLNADISREDSLISVQQKSLTAELNSANEIMQELPTQLDGINELYSAITGYNQTTNG
jgi:flagellar hook-associated protein 2